MIGSDEGGREGGDEGGAIKDGASEEMTRGTYLTAVYTALFQYCQHSVVDYKLIAPKIYFVSFSCSHLFCLHLNTKLFP